MTETTLSDDDGLTDELVDRLVDGELTLAEQRGLIEQLELSPNGWRRVGLAFLEAQSLRQSCHHMTASVAEVPTSSVILKADSRHNRTHIVTTAAAILLAFAVGLAVGHPWSNPAAAVSNVAKVESTANERQPGASPLVESVPVALQYGDGAVSEAVTTPVVDASSPEGQAWLRATPGVSERVRELLRQHGQKLQERQEWVEIDLADGRRGYLPVQEWTVSPVSLADFR